MTEGNGPFEAPTDLLAPGIAPAHRLVAFWKGGDLDLEVPKHGVFIVGRAPDCDVRIDIGSVSRQHARLSVGDSVTVEDLGSANGTWVEGRRLKAGAPTPLRLGEAIEIGGAMLLLRGAVTPSQEALAEDPAVLVVDEKMAHVHRLLEVVARSTLSVILLGETGVGKEVLATHVHEASPRARGPFLKLNCAALMESLLEAELFGYEKGAFTGAQQAKAGLFEAASGGTAFLDEIGEMPLTTQAKLLRAIENKEVLRLGALKPRPLDVRFVAATNRDLGALVEQKLFRADLFFRLDGMSVLVPPLRERPSEIGPLAELFVRQAAEGTPVRVLSDAAITRLRAYHWPGNIRELKNVIRRAVVLSEGRAIGPEQLVFGTTSRTSSGPESGPPSSRHGVTPDAGSSGRDAERRARVLDALEKTAGNQTRAAELLGVSRRTFMKWMDGLEIPRPRKG